MNKTYCQGFSLLGAIFILIILAVAGIYLMKLGGVQQQITLYNILDVRAKLAVESAFELSASRLKNQTTSDCENTSYQFDKRHKALEGFNVSIHCLKTIKNNQNPQKVAYQLQAVASKGKFGDQNYVSHQETKWIILPRS